jgi:hypothetical protein
LSARIIAALKAGTGSPFEEGWEADFGVLSEASPDRGLVQFVRVIPTNDAPTLIGEWQYQLTQQGFVALIRCVDF